jgi:hypothetical protein
MRTDAPDIDDWNTQGVHRRLRECISKENFFAVGYYIEGYLDYDATIKQGSIGGTSSDVCLL